MRVIRRRTNSIGIASTQAIDVITSNFVDSTFGGTRFVWAQGATAKGNKGYPTTAVTDENLFATLHAESGEVLTTSLTATASPGSFTVTLTNNLINANSRVMVRLEEGTNTKYPITLRGAEFNGGIWITGDNMSGENLDGSVTIKFDVIN
jgi:hypothetical protein